MRYVQTSNDFRPLCLKLDYLLQTWHVACLKLCTEATDTIKALLHPACNDLVFMSDGKSVRGKNR